MLRLGCLLLPLLLLAVPIIVSRYMPAWAVALIVVGELWGIGKLVPWLIKAKLGQLASSFLRRQYDALAGAGVHVHNVDGVSVNKAARPAMIETDGTPVRTPVLEDGPRIVVDVTITPTAHEQPPAWDARSIRLVPRDPALDPPELVSAKPVDAGAVGTVMRGRARVRLTFTAPFGLAGRASLGYGPHVFGDFLLPVASATQPTQKNFI